MLLLVGGLGVAAEPVSYVGLAQNNHSTTTTTNNNNNHNNRNTNTIHSTPNNDNRIIPIRRARIVDASHVAAGQRHINGVVSKAHKYDNFGFGGIKRPF